jgi:hypothetical protein
MKILFPCHNIVPSPSYRTLDQSHRHLQSSRSINMCTTFRVYYYCGHLKRTTYIEHSGIECTQHNSKHTVVDAKCPRCIARKSQRDERLGSILDGNKTLAVVEGEAVYDAGDELSASEQEVLLGDIRAQAMGNTPHRSCEDMMCDCDGCPSEDAPIGRQRTRTSAAVGREVYRDARNQAAKSSRQPRKEEEQWRCFGPDCNCSKCVRIRGSEHVTQIPQPTNGGRMPLVGGSGATEGYRNCGKRDCECALCEAVIDERPGQ